MVFITHNPRKYMLALRALNDITPNECGVKRLDNKAKTLNHNIRNNVGNFCNRRTQQAEPKTSPITSLGRRESTSFRIEGKSVWFPVAPIRPWTHSAH